jgi:hypothetical protein
LVVEGIKGRIVPFFERSAKNGRNNTRRKGVENKNRIPVELFCQSLRKNHAKDSRPNQLSHTALPVMSQFEMAVSVVS